MPARICRAASSVVVESRTSSTCSDPSGEKDAPQAASSA